MREYDLYFLTKKFDLSCIYIVGGNSDEKDNGLAADDGDIGWMWQGDKGRKRGIPKQGGVGGIPTLYIAFLLQDKTRVV